MPCGQALPIVHRTAMLELVAAMPTCLPCLSRLPFCSLSKSLFFVCPPAPGWFPSGRCAVRAWPLCACLPSIAYHVCGPSGAESRFDFFFIEVSCIARTRQAAEDRTGCVGLRSWKPCGEFCDQHIPSSRSTAAAACACFHHLQLAQVMFLAGSDFARSLKRDGVPA